MTFQHAVEVVRRLGFQYLWIDNTSIIQGNEDDWARESEKMAQYFGNATFTIAAFWASNDDKGLFHNRNPLVSRPLRLNPVPVEAGKTLERDAFYVCLKGDQDSSPPLTSRAWVLQEQMLSRRLLKFGDAGISWQCFSISSASEYKPSGIVVPPYQHNTAKDLEPMRIQLRLADYDLTAWAQRNPYYDSWYGVVEDFTRRNMKFKKDALPALSGLAQAFAPRLGDGNDTYVAGLWKDDIRLGLLWVVDTIGFGCRLLPAGVDNFLSDGPISPSWSWISCCHKAISIYFNDLILPGGAYSYLADRDFVGTDILKVNIQHRSKKEPYGQVLGGTLHVRAKLSALRQRSIS